MIHQSDLFFGVRSPGIRKIPFLANLLGGIPRSLFAVNPRSLSGVLGWGQRPTTPKALAYAQRYGLPFVALEDGFLRSFGTGENFPPLSIVVDEDGIYYDSTRPSALEKLLNSDADVLCGIENDVQTARCLMLRHRLSKYNHAPDWRCDDVFRDNASAKASRVLVVDQTAGDMSVALGGACAETFSVMLAAALVENPGATIYVKTHPEVTSGRKRGYLSHVQEDAGAVVLREVINPLSLIEQMDRVYVVSSTMGFEALQAGKPVTCFGLPWYAGWGATDDRLVCSRRTRQRSVDELFAAGYFHYCRYLDPVTHQRGTIFDVIDWLARQRRMAFGDVFPHVEDTRND